MIEDDSVLVVGDLDFVAEFARFAEAALGDGAGIAVVQADTPSSAVGDLSGHPLPSLHRVKVALRSSRQASRWLMNSLPLSESTPGIGNGKAAAVSSSVASNHLRASLRTQRVSGQPVAMSVAVSVKVRSPAALPSGKW